MATWDLVFDVSAYLYPQYGGGLQELTEEVTLSNFISSFESFNNGIEFTPEQLKECWFYALDYEYQQIMSNKAHMTEEEIEFTEKLLSKGMQQGTIFDGRATEWDVAEYTPPMKVPDVTPKRQRKEKGEREIERKRERIPKNSTQFDPLLLLQSMPNIRAQAERFYQDGLENFLSQGQRAQSPGVVASYKNSCVNQAEIYVTCLLIDKYRKDEQEGDGQFSQYENSQIQNPSHEYKWKLDPKWESVKRQIKAARRRMISEVGTSPLTEQDAVMDTSDMAQNPKSSMSDSQKTTSHTSGLGRFFRTVDKIEYRSVVRSVREGKLLGDVGVAEVAKVMKRSDQQISRQLRLGKRKHQRTGLENALENFSFGPAKEVLNVGNQKRRKQKVAARTRNRIGKNKSVNMDTTFSTKKSAGSFRGGAQSTSVIGYPESVGFPIKQEYMHFNTLALSSNSTANQSFSFPSVASGLTPRSSKLPLGAEIKIENQDSPTSYRARETFTATPTSMGVSDAWSMITRSKSRASIMRTQIQDMRNLKMEQVDREPFEMDIEISSQIADLTIKK